LPGTDGPNSESDGRKATAVRFARASPPLGRHASAGGTGLN